MFVDCQNKKSRTLPASVQPNNIPKICNIFLSIYFSSVSILFNPPREYCQYCVLFPGSDHGWGHRRTFLLAMCHKDNIMKDNEHMEVNSAFINKKKYVPMPIVNVHIRSLPENQHLGCVRVTFLGDFSSLS